MFASMYVSAPAVRLRRTAYWVPWIWNKLQMVRSAVWMLGTECSSSARSADAPKHPAIPQSLQCCFSAHSSNAESECLDNVI